MRKAGIDFTIIYKKYPGKWVALANDEKTVVGSGKTAKEALQESKKQKESSPILFRVPSKISLSVGISMNA